MSVHNVRNETMQPGDVYVGRYVEPGCHTNINLQAEGTNGYFGNPFYVYDEKHRDEVIAKFEAQARFDIATDPQYRDRVRSLHGKRLFCWCAPKRCHADVLEALACELATEVVRQ